tara:strand:+ start:338 stop:667 length:330 start_codon:yes stop_codon:yes gene_type:complete
MFSSLICPSIVKRTLILRNTELVITIIASRDRIARTRPKLNAKNLIVLNRATQCCYKPFMKLRDNLLLMQDTQSWTEGSAMALCVTPRGAPTLLSLDLNNYLTRKFLYY